MLLTNRAPCCDLPGTIHRVKFQPTRVIAGAWMISCVVLCASYTANLVAWLTVAEVKMPFDTLEEMVVQTEYSYGVKKGTIAQVMLQVMLRYHLGNTLTAQRNTIHQVPIMLATAKNVLFPGHNHLLTIGTDGPSF